MVNTIAIDSYELHELVEVFPEMQDEEFAALKASIALNGFDPTEPITLWQGKVIDGRHRLRACRELGVEPAAYALADDVDPAVYILRKNGGARRSLTPGQRAIIAARLSAWSTPDGPRKSIWVRGRRWHNPEEPIQMTQGQTAEAMAVSVRLVSQAAAVLKAFDDEPAVVRMVEQGKASLNEVLRLRSKEIRDKMSDKGYPVIPYLSSEAEFQAVVIDKFNKAGWLSHYFHANQWTGDAGWPDLLLVNRAGRLIWAELKSEGGVIRNQQYKMIELLRKGGHEVYVWQPSDLPEIERIIEQAKSP